MPKFSIVVAKCNRYEIEAESEDAAISEIKTAWYKDGRREFKDTFDDMLIDFFTRFEGEGEILDERGKLLQEVLNRFAGLGKPEARSFFDDYDIDDLAELYDRLTTQTAGSPARESV